MVTSLHYHINCQLKHRLRLLTYFILLLKANQLNFQMIKSLKNKYVKIIKIVFFIFYKHIFSNLLCNIINNKYCRSISIKRFYYRSEAFLSRLSNNSCYYNTIKIKYNQ